MASVTELLHEVRLIDRYEAAIRLERARQVAREAFRYGLVVTRAHRDEVHAAEQEYDRATAALQLTEG